jgi:hypothetical protein
MNLNLTPSDRNFLTVLRITTEADPIPFDASAAEAMVRLHRIAEAQQRDRYAALEAELARVNAAFERWIASGNGRVQRSFGAFVVGVVVGVLVGLAWGKG